MEAPITPSTNPTEVREFNIVAFLQKSVIVFEAPIFVFLKTPQLERYF
jgi:hypothetical protein